MFFHSGGVAARLLCSGASLMTYLMLPADVKSALSRHADEHPDLSRRSRTRAAQ